MRDAVRRLDRLREIRPTRPTASTVGGDNGVLTRLVESLKTEDSLLGRAERALRQELPPEIAAACRLESCDRGKLTVRVPDAATRYRLDRWVRSVGAAKLRESVGRELRVHILIG